MNQFLTPMTELLLNQSATIDKYIGDCIMAFWNAPLDDPAHAAHACQAACNMRQYLVHWNQEWKVECESKGRPPIPVNIGIGINTGECCVGNMGSVQHFNYSVLGDEVNLASRLEGQSKAYGVDIVLGMNTREQILKHNFAVLELDLLQVKGKTKPARIFGLLGDHTLLAADNFSKLSKLNEGMLAAYRSRDWENALKLIDECLLLDTPQTRLRYFYKLYKARIQGYQANPPSANWEGVTVAMFK